MGTSTASGEDSLDGSMGTSTDSGKRRFSKVNLMLLDDLDDDLLYSDDDPERLDVDDALDSDADGSSGGLMLITHSIGAEFE